MDPISEHRENKINLGENFISHEKSAPDSFFECKIDNISSEGVYIECDFSFDLNEKADLNAYKIVNHAKSDYFRFPYAKIKWKRDLRDSDFMFGYGLQFTESFQPFKDFITNTKEERQFLFLSDVLEILGFAIFLAYCILGISFGFKRLGEPFDLLIVGCGLISFSRIPRIFTKNFKILSKENKAINDKVGIF